MSMPTYQCWPEPSLESILFVCEMLRLRRVCAFAYLMLDNAINALTLKKANTWCMGEIITLGKKCTTHMVNLDQMSYLFI